MTNDTYPRKVNETDVKNIEDFGAGLEQKTLLFMFVLGIYIIVSVLGNSIVCFVYQTRIKTDSESRFFIPILAIIDILACIANCSLQMSDVIIGIVSDSDICCKLMWFFGLSTTAASMLVLLILAIDRYLIICRPQGRQMTVVWKKMNIAIIIMIAMIIGAPSFLIFGSTSGEVGNLERQKCKGFLVDMPWLSYAYNVLLFSLIVLELLVLSVLYSLICRGIYRQSTGTRVQKADLESPTKLKKTNTRMQGADNKSKTTCYEMKIMGTSAKSERNEIRMVSFGTLNREESRQSIMKTKCKTDDRKSLLSTKKKGADKDITKRYSNVISSLKTAQASTRASSPKITIMFTVITIVFIVSILPKLVLLVLETVKPGFRQSLADEMDTGLLFVSSVYIASFFVKPFIYAIMDVKFQNWLKTCCSRRKLLVTSL